MSLPTVEQVREHAERHGGVWRATLPADARWMHCPVAPMLLRLSVSPKGFRSMIGVPSDHPLWAAPDTTTWTPCDQEGNPLPLASALAETQRLLDVAEAGWHMEMSQVMELRARAEKAEQERDAERARADKAEANYRWMVEHAADQKLDGYREIAAKVAAAEEERDKLRHELAVVAEELDIKTGCGADAMRKALRDWCNQQQWDQGAQDDE